MLDGPDKTFTAGAAIGTNLRVKLSSGKLALAGASDTDCLGYTRTVSFADGDHQTVRLRNAAGTVDAVAAGAITAGAAVFAAASGKVAASGTVAAGHAITAAGANNDVIEILPP